MKTFNKLSSDLVDTAEYNEKLPFISEIIRRIDDISQAIKQGKSGIDEAYNLISDFPDEWLVEIQTQLDAFQATYDSQVKQIEALYGKRQNQSYRSSVDLKLLEAGKAYTRKIKRLVVNMLYKKNLLFNIRKDPPTSIFVDYHDSQDTEAEELKT